jgi:hypothetical protein
MKAKILVAGLVLLGAMACAKADDNETVDTSTIRGTDTVSGKAVPVTDTVVKTTETDTIHGSAHDTTKRDTTKAGTTKRP